MTKQVVFVVHMDSHQITQPIQIQYAEDRQFHQQVATLLSQFSAVGFTQNQEDGTLKHFPPHRIQFIVVEFPLVVGADNSSLPSVVRV